MAMTRVQGQILRLTGILVEMLGCLALLYMTRTGPDGAPVPGAIPQRAAWAIIAGGFGIWATGNAIIYWPQRGRRRKINGEAREGEGMDLRL